MKMDWTYITRENASKNIEIITMTCIRILSARPDIDNDTKAERLAGILMLNEAIRLNLEDDENAT